MKSSKLIELAEFYGKFFIDDLIAANRNDNKLERAHWCCTQIPILVNTDRIEKAMRWIGFVQGVLFATNRFTIDELKEHSRSIIN